MAKTAVSNDDARELVRDRVQEAFNTVLHDGRLVDVDALIELKEHYNENVLPFADVVVAFPLIDESIFINASTAKTLASKIFDYAAFVLDDASAQITAIVNGDEKHSHAIQSFDEYNEAVSREE